MYPVTQKWRWKECHVLVYCCWQVSNFSSFYYIISHFQDICIFHFPMCYVGTMLFIFYENSKKKLSITGNIFKNFGWKWIITTEGVLLWKSQLRKIATAPNDTVKGIPFTLVSYPRSQISAQLSLQFTISIILYLFHFTISHNIRFQSFSCVLIFNLKIPVNNIILRVMFKRTPVKKIGWKRIKTADGAAFWKSYINLEKKS